MRCSAPPAVSGWALARTVGRPRVADRLGLARGREPHVGVASGHGVLDAQRQGRASNAVERRRPRWGRPAMRRATAAPDPLPSDAANEGLADWRSETLSGDELHLDLLEMQAGVGHHEDPGVRLRFDGA